MGTVKKSSAQTCQTLILKSTEGEYFLLSLYNYLAPISLIASKIYEGGIKKKSFRMRFHLIKSLSEMDFCVTWRNLLDEEKIKHFYFICKNRVVSYLFCHPKKMIKTYTCPPF